MTPHPRRPSRTFRRYLLLQAPGWIVVTALLWFGVESFGLPVPIALLLLAAWAVKDLALYPWLRDAYRDEDPAPSAALVGQIGRARDRFARSGYVQLGSELWRAELSAHHPPVEAGQLVRVRAVRGLTLVVEPATGSAGNDAP